MKRAWIAAVILVSSATALAQGPAAFEVASIRRSTSAIPGGSSNRMQPGGRLPGPSGKIVASRW